MIVDDVETLCFFNPLQDRQCFGYTYSNSFNYAGNKCSGPFELEVGGDCIEWKTISVTFSK